MILPVVSQSGELNLPKAMRPTPGCASSAAVGTATGLKAPVVVDAQSDYLGVALVELRLETGHVAEFGSLRSPRPDELTSVDRRARSASARIRSERRSRASRGGRSSHFPSVKAFTSL